MKNLKAAVSGNYEILLAERDALREQVRELREALADLCRCLAPTDAHVAAIGKQLGPSLQGKLIHARNALKVK